MDKGKGRLLGFPWLDCTSTTRGWYLPVGWWSWGPGHSRANACQLVGGLILRLVPAHWWGGVVSLDF